MRRTIHATILTFAVLASTALAQVTYLALEPQTTLEAAEAQAAALEQHETTIITETTAVPGYERINLQQHTYRVLIGPLDKNNLENTRAELAQTGHQPQATTLDAELKSAYQIQIGAYRSDRLAADASGALEALGEPNFTQHAPPFTFVHAGPYTSRADANTALERIHDAGITTPTLGTLTPEHQTAINQQREHNTPTTTTSAPPATTTQLPIPLPNPHELEDELPVVTAAAHKLEGSGDATGETPATKPTAAVAAHEPKTTTTQADAKNTISEETTTPTKPITAVAEPAEEPQIKAATAEAHPNAVEEPAAQVVAADLTLPSYIHIASGNTTNHFDLPLAALADLELEPVIRASGETYRLYVGPMPLGEANELRTTLRTRGIATFTTETPTGHTAALPEPEPQATTNEDTPEKPKADADEAEPATSREEAIIEPPKEPAWQPKQPILANRESLQPGTYLTARSSTNLNDLQDARHTLEAAEYELAFLQAGKQTVLLVGPLAEWQEDTVRKDLRRRGMPAHAVHHPNHVNQSAQVAMAAAKAPAPANYLALDPHDDLNTLQSKLPNLTLVHNQTLIGPIPNDELERAARSLTRLADVTFHPYPTAPENGNADDWTAYAYTLLEYQQTEPARQAFLEARALDPTHYDALFGLAVTEDQLGNSDAAEFAYQYVMNTHPERFEARFNYALRTHALHGTQAAIRHHQQALALTTDYPNETRAQAHAALAGALTTINDHHGAAEHYEAAYTLTGDLNHLVARFEAQRAAGQSLDLLPELTSYELETRDARFTALIADIYLQAHQIAYAQDTINRRMRDTLTTSQETLLLNARAATYAASRNPTHARTDLETALELTPNDPTTHHNLGLMLLAQGHAATALPHLQAAVQLGITDPLARLDIAEAAARTEDHQTAAQNALAAAETLTGDARYRALRIYAQSATNLRDYTSSLSSLEELLLVTPNDAHMLAMAGTAYYQTGQYARAAERLETAYNLTGDTNISAALANAYLASQRYSDAERVLRATLAVTPDDADALHKLGWALLHLGNHQAAQTAWANASALNHAQAQEDLARVFAQ